MGAPVLQARCGRVQGVCDQAHPPDDSGRQAHACDRRADPLGIHWQARKGYGANTLTPSVGDANTETPEFKAFLVNVERTGAPAPERAADV